MKKPTTAPAASAPAFDPATAQAVPPIRHRDTARTVGHVQLQGAEAHLFSATRDYIATVPAAKAAAYGHKAAPAAPAPAETPAST